MSIKIMRNLVYIILMMLSLISCNDVTSIYNYNRAIIVEKYHTINEVSGDKSYYLRIRIKNSSDDYFRIETIRVPQFEYYLVELGDTIKRNRR